MYFISDRFANLGRLLIVALATWQVSIPLALTIASSSTLLNAEVAAAVESAPVTIVQGFGWGCN